MPHALWYNEENKNVLRNNTVYAATREYTTTPPNVLPEASDELFAEYYTRMGTLNSTPRAWLTNDRRKRVGSQKGARASTLSNIVRQFAPNRFIITVGTGALAATLYQVAGMDPAVQAIAAAFWLLDIILFLSFTVIYAAHWVFFLRWRTCGSQSSDCVHVPRCDTNGASHHYQRNSHLYLRRTAVSIARALCWGDAAMAVACGMHVPFLMFTV